jgi:hypothetical protein
MVTLSRNCVACRRLIPEDIGVENTVLTFASVQVKWVKKNHVHKASIVEGEIPCFCEACAAEMTALIEAQAKKGIKVL